MTLISLKLLDAHNIHVCLLPANTTDRLQPMDISVNKLAKDFLKRQFDQWYSEQVLAQLEGQDTHDLNALELQPVNLGLPCSLKGTWSEVAGGHGYLHQQ